ncbi:MAG: glycerophosphodiester phosphodiesterase [Acidobacteriaceae bacterium]
MAVSARPLLLGHRGARLRQFRENSMSAFRHALDSGCDGFEFDVRISGDHRLLCVHDANIGDFPVAAASYQDLCGESSRVNGNNEDIAGLDEVLREFATSAVLDIELKAPGFESAVFELVKRYRTDRYVISSFLAEVILDLAEIDPTLPLGFIFDDVAGLRAYPNLPVSYVMPRYDLLNRDIVDAFHRDKKKVFTWTVNRPGDMLRLAEYGVDGLISDDPALLYRTITGR